MVMGGVTRGNLNHPIILKDGPQSIMYIVTVMVMVSEHCSMLAKEFGVLLWTS